MPDVGARPRVAVLIDGDNAEAALLPRILSELSGFGTPNVRRIYGDWAAGKLNGWTEGLHEHAFEAIQQHSFTKGKNATDGRLIIDAMDLLHAGIVDVFCIVSSDSDYTGLAKRLRASGKHVVGVGAKHTPQPFVKACDRFVATELLKEVGGDRGPSAESRAPKEPTKSELSELRQRLVAAVDAMADESGIANLSRVKEWLVQQDPSFDSRRYGGRSRVSLLFKFFPETFEFADSSFTTVRRKQPQS